MGGTTTNGWPYVTPDDHPFEFPAASQTLANKLDAQVPLVKLRTVTGPYTTDTNGFFTVPATTFGLTTLTGAMASIVWGATYNGTTPHIASARISGSAVQVLVLGMSAGSAATLNRILSTSVTAYIIAWGT